MPTGRAPEEPVRPSRGTKTMPSRSGCGYQVRKMGVSHKEGAAMVQLKPVEEQVVALMGASSGIGRETALRFAARGARVVVSARGEQGLNTLVQEIRNEGGQATEIGRAHV